MKTDDQAQREALIQLMLAARYEDGKLSLAENDAFKKQVESLTWESGTAIEIFLQESTARVREVLTTDARKQRFLEAQCAEITDIEHQKSALKSIAAVLEADGIDVKESSLLQQISHIWGL